MTSIIVFLERVITPADERRNWALQRIEELKRALATGRISAREYIQRLRYWNQLAAGAPAGPMSAQAGLGPSHGDIRTAGTFF